MATGLFNAIAALQVLKDCSADPADPAPNHSPGSGLQNCLLFMLSLRQGHSSFAMLHE